MKRARYRIILRAGISAVLLIGLIWMLDVRQLYEALGQVSLPTLMLALVLALANVSLEAWKWHLLLRSLAPHIPWPQSLRSLLLGYALGLFTPVRSGEYLGRMLVHRDLPRRRVFQRILVDKLQNLACYLLLGLLALLWLAPDHPALLGSMALLVLPGSWLREIPPALWAKTWGLSLLRYALICTQFVLLLGAGFHGTAYAGVALLYLTKALVPALAFLDLGIREGAAVLIFPRLGYDAHAAFLAALMMFLLNLVLPALLALPLIWRKRHA